MRRCQFRGRKESMPISPIQILREATKAIPAVRYALGVAGIVAAVAIVRALTKDVRVALLGTLAMFVGMIFLFAFAKLATSTETTWRLPVQALFAFFIIYIMAAAALLFTSVFFGRPLDLRDLIVSRNASASQEPPPAGDPLIASLVARLEHATSRPDLLSAIDALRAYALSTSSRSAQDTAASKLKNLLCSSRVGSPEDRPIRKVLLEALKSVRRGDLHADFQDGALAKSDLVGADLSGADLTAVTFEGSFLIETDLSGTTLARANLDDTLIRNVNMDGANLAGASLKNADWFNARGLNVEQLGSARRDVLERCPKRKGYSEAAFVSYLADNYKFGFTSWSVEVQQDLRKAWKEYGRPNGLCDRVSSWR